MTAGSAPQQVPDAAPSAPPGSAITASNIEELVGAGGCFGWSAKTSCALCVVGEESWQEGGRYDLIQVGCDATAITLEEWESGPRDDDVEFVLSEETSATLQDLVAKGDYRGLAIEAEGLSPGDSLPLPGGAMLHWTWDEAGIDEGDGITGSWALFEGSIQLSCTGEDGDLRTVSDESIESDENPSAEVILLPGEQHVLLISSWSLAIEGDYGGSTFATLVDLKEECGS